MKKEIKQEDINKIDDFSIIENYDYNSRYACGVLDEILKCNDTRNYSYLNGLVEELRVMYTRMESKLHDRQDYYRLKKNLINQIKKAEENEIEVKTELLEKDSLSGLSIGVDIDIRNVVNKIREHEKDTGEKPETIKIKIKKGSTLFGIPIEFEIDNEDGKENGNV